MPGNKKNWWRIVARMISLLMVFIAVMHYKALRLLGVDTISMGFRLSVMSIVIGFFLLNLEVTHYTNRDEYA